MIESVAHDLLPVLEKDKNVEIVVLDPLGLTYVLRYNWKQPPFNDVRYRRAATLSLNQKDFLQAVIGDPRYYKECKAMFGCGTPLETSAGMQGLLESRFEESRKLLKELGYDGTPIVVLQTSDNPTLTNLAPVTKTLLERGGFKVDVQSMDWQTLVARRAKKDPVGAGRLEHRPDRGGGRAAARSGQQPLCRGERRPRPVRLAARRGDREAPHAVHPRGRSQEAARDRREGPDAHPRAKASPCRSASSSNRWRGATP